MTMHIFYLESREGHVHLPADAHDQRPINLLHDYSILRHWLDTE